MHGAKDKFDAKKLLGTPIDEIPVSDDEEEEEKKEFPNDIEAKSPVAEPEPA